MGLLPRQRRTVRARRAAPGVDPDPARSGAATRGTSSTSPSCTARCSTTTRRCALQQAQRLRGDRSPTERDRSTARPSDPPRPRHDPPGEPHERLPDPRATASGSATARSDPHAEPYIIAEMSGQPRREPRQGPRDRPRGGGIRRPRGEAADLHGRHHHHRRRHPRLPPQRRPRTVGRAHACTTSTRRPTPRGSGTSRSSRWPASSGCTPSPARSTRPR